MSDEIKNELVEEIETVEPLVEEEEVEEIRPNMFTKKEFNRLERNNDVRDMMIHKLMENGQVPDDPRKIRLLKEIMVEQDTSIHQVVGAKLKSKELDSDSKYKSAALELLASIKPHTESSESGRNLEFKEGLSTNYTPVPGQMDQGVIPINPDDIIE